MNPKKHLAALAVQAGVNIQPGQTLYINTPVECMDFARELAEVAFEAGAGDVQMRYQDEVTARLRYEHASEETLTKVPEWAVKQYEDVLENKGAVISIHAQNPKLLEGLDVKKIQKAVSAREIAAKDYSKAISANVLRWCVLSVPTDAWAAQVFPEAQNPSEKLWEAILDVTGSNETNTLAYWLHKDAKFKARADYLNQKQYKAFHYQSPEGTDLVVGMPENYLFSGGSEVAQDGIRFFPNLPTEEIFAAPHKDRVNGRLLATMPLNYQGQLIEGIDLSFEDGKVVKASAEKGEDVLKALIASTPGSDQLGEIAMVPVDSKISESGILFYNTLFDENASCHFALGQAYPSCVEGGEKLDEDEQAALGLNQSLTHVDFMVGSPTLNIYGVLENGEEEPVMLDGKFVI